MAYYAKPSIDANYNFHCRLTDLSRCVFRCLMKFDVVGPEPCIIWRLLFGLCLKSSQPKVIINGTAVQARCCFKMCCCCSTRHHLWLHAVKQEGGNDGHLTRLKDCSRMLHCKYKLSLKSLCVGISLARTTPSTRCV